MPQTSGNVHGQAQLHPCADTWLLVKVLHPTQHKIGHFRDVPQASLLAWYGKTKPNATKALGLVSPIKRNVLQHKINTKKLKPGLVTSYDVWPGNGEELF